MTTFIPHQRTYQAVIFSDGRVEVRQAVSPHVEGCVYFSSGTKAFKVATQLIAQGLIAVKRKGFMVTTRGYMVVRNSYYLGAIVLPTQDKETIWYTDEVAKSSMIHGVSHARS